MQSAYKDTKESLHLSATRNEERPADKSLANRGFCCSVGLGRNYLLCVSEKSFSTFLFDTLGERRPIL